jgi:hypothetical protein
MVLAEEAEALREPWMLAADRLLDEQLVDCVFEAHAKRFLKIERDGGTRLPPRWCCGC